MKLSNSFTIDRPVDEVYQAFLQVERIATCMPGSTLLGQPEPGTYEGEVKVKVGPLGVNYTGRFVILDADDAAHRLTMRAKAREKQGAGNADAHIVAALSESEGGTLVQLDTDLDIRGKVAQFGRGVIGEVTDSIMKAFAHNVEEMLRSPGTEEPTPGRESAHEGARATAGSGDSAMSDRTGDSAAAAPSPTGTELDAWSLVLRPMLQRHAADIATVAFSGLAAWLGARAGARGRSRPRCH